jgi:hypothetical protein
MLPDADLLYAAVAERNADYEGVFFVGVRTTGVFCRPLSLPGEASEVVRRLVDAVERIEGNPDPKHVSTSYAERNNLNMHSGRMTRLTNAF